MKKCHVCGKPVERDKHPMCRACSTEYRRKAFAQFGLFQKVNKNVEATVKLMNETVTD